MSEIGLSTRIQQRHDTEYNWLQKSTFIPKDGELIIYDAERAGDTLPTGRTQYYSYPRVKIGDGITNIVSLPFITNLEAEPNQNAFSKLNVDNTTIQTAHAASTTLTLKNVHFGQGYGTCSTATTSSAKVVSMTDFKLVTGGIVSIYFEQAVNSSATLNINNTGAKPIYYKSSPIANNVIGSEDIVTFIYTGSFYRLISIDSHSTRTDNPHKVTKAQLGLGNVDNTSDLDKPISTAVQSALDNKVSSTLHSYSNNNDSDESNLNSWLDALLQGMDNWTFTHVVICSYPAIHGSRLSGTLYKSTNDYATLELHTYGNFRFKKIKDLTWRDTRLVNEATFEFSNGTLEIFTE